MTHACQGTAVVLLLAALPVWGDDSGKKVAPAVEVQARFQNGTIVRKAVMHEDIELVTKYGKLTVPAGEIRRIEFGLRLSEPTAARVANAVSRLGSAEYREREAAGKELVALGHRAYPALRAAIKSADREVATRASAALKKIEAAVPAELLQLKDHDVIYTAKGTMTGRIPGSLIKARTENFGDVAFKLADLLSIASLAGNGEITVVADAFTLPIRWHDTGIDVESGMGLVIRASGEIAHPSSHLGHGIQLVSGPEGNLFASGTVHRAGTLVGKIGDQRDFFVIGTHFEGKLTQAGRLYLFVAPWQKGAKPTGSYRVEVTTGPDLARGAKPLQAIRRTSNDLETILEPKRLLCEKLVNEIIVWTDTMCRPDFGPEQTERYEKGIQQNMKQLDDVQIELRREMGGLFPMRWLEEPFPVRTRQLIWR